MNDKYEIDDSAVGRVNELCKKYQETYGKEIDFTIIPKSITQEKLEKCIRLMIDDNISLVVAYDRLYRK